MKLHILSDLHLEFSDFAAPDVGANVVVLAGDIDLHTRGLDWAIQRWKDENVAVLYVPGNHEFYGAELHGIRQQLEAKAEEARQAGFGIWVLDDKAVELCDASTGRPVRFLGSTLWTDYKLFGEREMPYCMAEARRGLNDHRVIRCAPDAEFSPSQAAKLNRQSLAWLSQQLALPFDGRTVVVTHHLPSMLSVSDRFKSSVLSAAFASNFDHLVARADLWIHGHTHDNFDYRMKGCQVICNPRGYVTSRGVENPNFNPELVVEI